MAGPAVDGSPINGRSWVTYFAKEVLRDPLYKGEGYFNRTGPTDAQRPQEIRGYKEQRPGNQQVVCLRPQEEQVLVPAKHDF